MNRPSKFDDIDSAVLESSVDETAPGMPGPTLSLVLEETNFPLASAKLNIAQSFLNLIVKENSFQDFMRESLLVVLRNLNCEAGSILELDYRTQNLFFRAVAGRSSDRVSTFTVPMGKGIAGHVAEARQPVIVQDVPENKVHFRSIASAVGFEPRNLLAYPILIRGKTFGVVELLNRIGQVGFSDPDLELMEFVAETLARAIEARLLMTRK